MAMGPTIQARGVRKPRGASGARRRMISMQIATAVKATSDPAPETVVDSCKIQGEGFTLPCSISADRAIWIDLATLPRGRVYTITAQFCVQGGLWCSDPSAPFSFPAPMVGSPSTMRLSIQ